MTESSEGHLVGVALPTLRQLRSAVLSATATDAAVTALREAGFAGGKAVYSAFEEWLAESGIVDAGAGKSDAADLSLEEFGDGATRFFRNAGWGDVVFSQDDEEGVAIVDITSCWEGDAGGSLSGCHITTGLLAAFFGRAAGYPVAVLETECCAGDGSRRCRFVMGTAEVMNYKWKQMQ